MLIVIEYVDHTLPSIFLNVHFWLFTLGSIQIDYVLTEALEKT